ncbi:MAG TPA: hypothetical protein VNZ22_11980, partial [Bacillota bacterium]|nr:hypothetical protein [Bacillota bacterium]
MSLRAKVLAGGVLLGAVILGVAITAHYLAKEKALEYKRALQARGEKMTFAELRPAVTAEAASRAQALVTAVNQLGDVEADLTNFPTVMRSLGPGLAQVAWKQDPLPTYYSSNVWPDFARTLDEKQEPLAAIRGLLASPGVAFNLDYSQGFKLTMPHLARLKSAAVWLSGATIRELHAGQLDRAEQNLEALSALRSQQGEPMMWAKEVRLKTDCIAFNTTWEALQCPDWTEEQLRKLQAAWSSADWVNQAEAALAMQRLWDEQALATVRSDHSVIVCPDCGKTGPAEVAELGRQLLKQPMDGLKEIAARYPLYWWWVWWQSYDDELMSLQYLQAGIESVRAMRQHQLFGAAL